MDRRVAGGIDSGDPDDPQAYAHRDVRTNGIRMHVVDEGQGPLVLLLHGFPYLWYMWRRQIRALAAAGWRVVAPDLRGFGRSDCPQDVNAYTLLHSVADVVGLMCALGESQAVVVGHDLGAWVASLAAQTRPDLFRALVTLNTPAGPREAQPPSAVWQGIETATGKRLYHAYFQQQGIADAELNADIRNTLRRVYFSISSAAVGTERWRPLLSLGEGILDTMTDPPSLPDWLCERALDYCVGEYTRNGFTAPLNHYRNRDRSWELTAFLDGLPVRQPSLFIGGGADPALPLFRPLYETLERYQPQLRAKVLLDGVGHSAAEERPETVSRMLIDFLGAL